MTHRLPLSLALVLCLGCLGGPAAADVLVVVSNPGLTLGPDEVRDVYLGEKQLADGTKLVPIDNASAQAAFLARVIRLDAGKYAATWTKKSFRDGLNPPPVKANDAEVLEFVRRVPGSVGYITTHPSSGVNTVKVR